MTEPTDADRAKIRDILGDDLSYYYEGTADALAAALAAALAEERAKARAEFLRLADALDAGASIYAATARKTTGSDLAAAMVASAVKSSAKTIREYVQARDAGQEP